METDIHGVTSMGTTVRSQRLAPHPVHIVTPIDCPVPGARFRKYLLLRNRRGGLERAQDVSFGG